MLKLIDVPHSDSTPTPAPVLRRLRPQCHHQPHNSTPMWVTARRQDHSIDVYRQRQCLLYLQQMTDRGAAALSSIPLSLSERVILRLPGHRLGQTVEWPGRIVRCRLADREAELPYEIAIRFDTTAPAA